jgi:hypothetical protein
MQQSVPPSSFKDWKVCPTSLFSLDRREEVDWSLVRKEAKALASRGEEVTIMNLARATGYGYYGLAKRKALIRLGKGRILQARKSKRVNDVRRALARLAKGEYPSFCKVEKLTGHAVLLLPYLKQLVEAAQRKFQKARRNRIERTIGNIRRIIMSPPKGRRLTYRYIAERVGLEPLQVRCLVYRYAPDLKAIPGRRPGQSHHL